MVHGAADGVLRVVPITDHVAFDASDRPRVEHLVLAWITMVVVAISVGSQLPGATAYDHRISVWFVDHRSRPLDALTAVISGCASTFAVMSIALVVLAASLVWRRTIAVLFVVIAMAGEVAMFLT